MKNTHFNLILSFTSAILSAGCDSKVAPDTKPAEQVEKQDIVTDRDWKSYQTMDLQKVPMPKLMSAGFDDGTNQWNLPSDAAYAPGQGRDGSGALLIDRAESGAEAYKHVTQSFIPVPGASYSFEAWVKTENVQGSDTIGASIFIEYYKNDEWIGGGYPIGLRGTNDWTLVQRKSADVPSGATKANVGLYLRKATTGKVWFDDVKVEPVGGLRSVHMITPTQYLTPETDELNLRWRWEAENVTDSWKGNDLHVYVEISQDDKLLTSITAPSDGTTATLKLDESLPVGDLRLRTALVDHQTKTILHDETLDAVCVDTSKAPANAVSVDHAGRTLVGTKPFMPIGLYLMEVHDVDLERLRGTPFNTIMPYLSLSLRKSWNEKPTRETISERLDKMHASGLKVAFSIKDLYEGTRWAPKSWLGIEGDEEMVRSVVEAYRDHPALLAWYVCDEEDPSLVSRIENRRRLLHRIDPWHPSWAVHINHPFMGGYASTADIQGIDPYPVRDLQSQSMSQIATHIDAAKLGWGIGGNHAKAAWAVLQAHNQALYHKLKDGGDLTKIEHREELLRISRAPTEEEMRSMTLLTVINGFKGFIFYSYFDMLKPSVLPDFDQRWAELLRVATLLQDLEPFIMSDQPITPLDLDVTEGKVSGAMLRADDGRAVVILTAEGPGAAQATFQLPPDVKLKSKYDHSTQAPDGVWTFTGKNISSDILK